MSMLKSSASEPGTRTSFSFSLGTETYSVSVGLALLGLKVMGLTELFGFHCAEIFLAVRWPKVCLHSSHVIMWSTIKC